MAEKSYAQKSKISEYQRKEIAEFYRDSKLWSAKEVASFYDVSESAVRYAVQKYSCQKPKQIIQEKASKLENIAETSKPGFFKRFGNYVTAAAAGTILAAGIAIYSGCAKPENKPRLYSEKPSPTITYTAPAKLAEVEVPLYENLDVNFKPEVKVAKSPSVAPIIKPVYTAPVIPSPIAKPAYVAPAKSESLNLDNVLQDEIKADGRCYGLAGLGSVGDSSYLLEGGYKTATWGVGASLDSTALELKYGLFNKTKAEIDATIALILGEKSGAGINFGKDNVFGKNKDYNLRYSAGLGFADGAVVPVSVSLTKKLNDRWNIGLEARVNAGEETTAGAFATLSYGNNTFENALDGFAGAVKDEKDDKDSGNGTQTQTTTQNRDNGETNPLEDTEQTPDETDGTGRPALRK